MVFSEHINKHEMGRTKAPECPGEGGVLFPACFQPHADHALPSTVCIHISLS